VDFSITFDKGKNVEVMVPPLFRAHVKLSPSYYQGGGGYLIGAPASEMDSSLLRQAENKKVKHYKHRH
jgi:hypothetical protein